MANYDNKKLVNKLMSTIKNDILPRTQTGVKNGNKIFGAAILDKSSLDLIIAETNDEVNSPLFHGEIVCLNSFFSKRKDLDARNLIFLSTHEPCSMCLSAITWAGFNEIYFFFSHEDSRDDFNIPYDLLILKELFNLEPGSYNKNNAFFTCKSIFSLINQLEPTKLTKAMLKVKELKHDYHQLSLFYQQNKEKNSIPLK